MINSENAFLGALFLFLFSFVISATYPNGYTLNFFSITVWLLIGIILYITLFNENNIDHKYGGQEDV